ncbi:MAG TPA: hypothetical protein VD902_03940 [Symbiobacteriaceae bacterium]|nr:hypothetical protein [Symbiobacteriaceae bacterium]
MTGKSLELWLTDAEEGIRQPQAKRQTLVQQLRELERRERARCMIQVGVIMAGLGVDTPEKAQALQSEARERPEIRDWLHSVMQPKGAQDDS